jgi:hypothetical protein
MSNYSESSVALSVLSLIGVFGGAIAAAAGLAVMLREIVCPPEVIVLDLGNIQSEQKDRVDLPKAA